MATITASIPVPFKMTNAELKAELERFPDDATIDLRITPRDRPFDSEQQSIRLHYST